MNRLYDIRCQRRAGFTFIEIIATLVVMAALVGMIAAGRMVNASVPAEAAMLKSHLRYVQSLAIANNTVSWSVRLGQHEYELLRDGAASPVHWPGENAAVHDFPPGVRITGGPALIAFDRWGAPAESSVITVSDGHAGRTVQVTGFTGFIP